jgi:hypothetical protein
MSNIPIISFNSGLVTPHVDARADSEKYQSACRVLNNFIARMYGSAERRPGTYYINDMRDHDDPTTINGVTTCLLVPFIYSKTIAYILEFTGYYIRVYYGDAVVEEIDSPYAEADLFELQFKQLGDVIWITHEDYAQRKFTRYDATTFDLTIIPFNKGPFLKRNDLAAKDGMEMTIVGSALSLTSSSDATYNSNYGSTQAYKAFDENTATGFRYYGVNSWVSCKWDDAKTILRVRMHCYMVKYFRVQASNNGTAWTDIDANGWEGSCQEYTVGGNTDTEITDTNAGWIGVTLDNASGYTYWRVYVLGLHVYGFQYNTFINEIQMSTSATPADDDDAILTSSANFFSSDYVGALFAITQPRVNSSISFSITQVETSDDILVENAWTLSISTGWIGTVQLERKLKEDTEWELIRQWTSYVNTRAIQISGYEEEDNAYYRVDVSAYTSGTISGELTVDDPNHTGICKVIEYIDETNVKVNIVKDFVSEETSTRWYEGAWSDVRGYPSSCCFIENRCVYGGMKALANDTSLATVWLSATGDYENFDEGTKGADAFSITIETTETLTWVETMDNLVIGTTGGTYFIRSSKIDTVMVPNPPPICRQQSAYYCDSIRPVKAMKTMVYVSGRQLRELAYDRGALQWDSDLTALCEQITASPIVDMGLQTNPDTILWAAHEDGRLSAFVYDRENNVMAWAKMPLAESGGGITPKIKSVAIIPNSGSGDDIYVAVHRIINGPAVYDGTDAVYDGSEEVRDKISAIYVEKFAQRFE